MKVPYADKYENVEFLMDPICVTSFIRENQSGFFHLIAILQILWTEPWLYLVITEIYLLDS